MKIFSRHKHSRWEKECSFQASCFPLLVASGAQLSLAPEQPTLDAQPQSEQVSARRFPALSATLPAAWSDWFLQRLCLAAWQVCAILLSPSSLACDSLSSFSSLLPSRAHRVAAAKHWQSSQVDLTFRRRLWGTHLRSTLVLSHYSCIALQFQSFDTLPRKIPLR